MKSLLAGLLCCAWALGAEPGVASGEFGARRKSPPAASEDSNTNKPAAPAKQAAPKGYPFHGAIDTCAADGSAITLKGKAKARQIVVSKETRVTRDGKSCSLSEAAPGERVTGTVFRNADGKEQARTVRLGGASPGKR